MKYVLGILSVCVSIVCVAQIDKEKLALDISKADDANNEKIKRVYLEEKVRCIT
jgi:hypothetical protein